MNGNTNRMKPFIIVICAGIAAGIGIAVNLADFTTAKPQTIETRTVFWRHVHGLGVDPSDRSILYIATHGDFYQSVSGGPPVKVDEQRADYMAFSAPYSASAPLYASGHPAIGGNIGLIKSTDGGKTWYQVATILDPPVDFHSMSVSKSDPNIIIGFDSANRGLFRTVDGGQSWEKLDAPDYLSALAISSSDSNVVFAGAGNGLYFSSDGGTTWTQSDALKGDLVFALAFDEKGVLYASAEQLGLIRSLDHGKNWERLGTPGLTVTSIAADAQTGILYVAGYSAEGFQEVYKSSDDGATWSLIGTNKEL
ncbi:MAG: hypothetical protein QXW37_01710 [Candidatus Nitrosotenuis sp.]